MPPQALGELKNVILKGRDINRLAGVDQFFFNERERDEREAPHPYLICEIRGRRHNPTGDG